MLGSAIFGYADQASAQDPDALAWHISLVTVGPGQGFLSLLGHSAILVDDPRTGDRTIFDYGVVYSGPKAARRFMTGNALAHPAVSDGRATLAEWVANHRSVAIQRLDLSRDQRVAVLERLFADRGALTDYRYDVQFDNCTTRVRDLLDAATNGSLRAAGALSTGLTLREIGAQTATAWWLFALVNSAFNDGFDQPTTRWSASIYPEELSELVAATTIIGPAGIARPLSRGQSLQSVSRVGRSERASRDRVRSLILSVTIVAFTLLLGRAVKRREATARVLLGLWTALLGGALGLAGFAIAAAWLFSKYSFAYHNENVAILNPLLLLAVPLGLWYAVGSSRAARLLIRLLHGCVVIAAVAIVLKSTARFDQDNWRTILVAWPAVIALATAVRSAETRVAHAENRLTSAVPALASAHDPVVAPNAPTFSPSRSWTS